MDMISIGFIAAVFAAGLLSFFTPCVLPLLPVYIGYLADERMPEGKAGLAKAFAFVAGIAASFFLLGLGAGALGSVLNNSWFFLACGAMVVVLGLHHMGLFSIPFLLREKRIDAPFNPRQGLGGAFALGFFFSFGWTPCVGPVLGSVLGISAQHGGALTGGGLLLVYALGLGIPFAALALGSRRLLGRVKGLYPHFKKFQVAGGLLIMLMGGWMMMQQIDVLRAGSVSEAADATPRGMVMEALNAAPASLDDFRGKTVYVKFWATWCPLCLAGLEDFAALHAQYAHSPDIAVISVVMPGLNGEVDTADFIAWAEAQKLDFPVYFDAQGALIHEFGVRAYPTSVYLDPDGAVFKQTIGDEMNDQIVRTLSTLGTLPGAPEGVIE